nr:hypothetical protein [Tanacetum cinerariifolium]
MEDLKQPYLDELKRLSNLEYCDEIKIAELTENLNGDEHLDTIPATGSDEVIKSSVEDLDDSFSIDNIDYVEASPPDSELVSSEVMEIVIPEEFADELAHIISPSEYDRFYFRDLPDPGELMSVLNSEIRENLNSATSVNLPIEDDQSPLLEYVVWIFVSYLTYLVIPPYLHPFEN